MNSNRCDVCGEQNAEHNFDIAREGGATPVNTCNTCKKLARRLALVVTEPYCMWCWAPSEEKNEWIPYGNPAEPTHRICRDCRDQIIFSNKRLEAGPLGELISEATGDDIPLEKWPVPYNPDGKRVYDEYGNPIPSPLDECDACGVCRHERPNGFAPVIMTPYGEAEYLCRPCREQGRGMK